MCYFGRRGGQGGTLPSLLKHDSRRRATLILHPVAAALRDAIIRNVSAQPYTYFYAPSLQFNVLWLNPQNENTFPPGLIDALTLHSDLLLGVIKPLRQGDPTFPAGPDGRVTSEAQRLRLQMQADALQPLLNVDEDDDDGSAKARSSAVSGVDHYTPEILEEATQFLRLQVCDVVAFSPDFALSALIVVVGKNHGQIFLMLGLCVKLIRRYILIHFPFSSSRHKIACSWYCRTCVIATHTVSGAASDMIARRPWRTSVRALARTTMTEYITTGMIKWKRYVGSSRSG